MQCVKHVHMDIYIFTSMHKATDSSCYLTLISDGWMASLPCDLTRYSVMTKEVKHVIACVICIVAV